MQPRTLPQLVHAPKGRFWRPLGPVSQSGYKRVARRSAVARKRYLGAHHPTHRPSNKYYDTGTQTPPHVYNAQRDKFYVTRHPLHGVIITYYDDEDIPPPVAVADSLRVPTSPGPNAVRPRTPSKAPKSIQPYAGPTGAVRIAPVPSRPRTKPATRPTPAPRVHVASPPARLPTKKISKAAIQLAEKLRAAIAHFVSETIESRQGVAHARCRYQLTAQQSQVDRYQGFDPNQVRDQRGRWAKVGDAGGAKEQEVRKAPDHLVAAKRVGNTNREVDSKEKNETPANARFHALREALERATNQDIDPTRLSQERVNALIASRTAERTIVSTGHGPVTALVVRQKTSSGNDVVLVYKYVGHPLLWGDGNYWSLQRVLPGRYSNKDAAEFVTDEGLAAQQRAVDAEWSFVFHLIPMAATVDHASQGNTGEAALSAIGDLALGAGTAARALKKLPALAKVLSRTAMVADGSIGAVRTVTALQKFQSGDWSGATGDLAEALLRTAGVAIHLNNAPKPSKLPGKVDAPALRALAGPEFVSATPRPSARFRPSYPRRRNGTGRWEELRPSSKNGDVRRWHLVENSTKRPAHTGSVKSPSANDTSRPRKRMSEGNAFNKSRAAKYPHNEVYIERPGRRHVRLDSYNFRTGEIVSRKETQLADITEATGIGYVNELVSKYPPNAKIANVPSQRLNSRHPNAGLAGKSLRGQMILEIPVQNKPVPQLVIDAANRSKVVIRDVNGKVYNP